MHDVTGIRELRNFVAEFKLVLHRYDKDAVGDASRVEQ
jgi:hypothetical protein